MILYENSTSIHEIKTLIENHIIPQPNVKISHASYNFHIHVYVQANYTS